MNHATHLTNPSGSDGSIAVILEETLNNQRKACFEHGIPSLEQRKSDLLNLKRFVNENSEAILDAISRDYGNRSRHETIFGEIISVTDCINDCIKSLKKWTKVQSRHTDFTLYPGAKNRVIPQPLGVIGLIVPWNFPINLSFVPLAAALAAGNRAMVKMSENSIHLTRLLIEKMPDYFSRDKLVFFEETGGVGIEFSKLPYDLMVFTGSGQTGRSIMAAAAPNLTPVILELGGKAPAVIDPTYPMEKAVQRIMFAKHFNAGQICVNVDYLFLHETQLDEFIRLAKIYVNNHCPDIEHADYTSVIDNRSFDRLMETLEDVRAKGGTVLNLSETQEPNSETRKMPVHLAIDTSEDMIVRQRETFGPILMVMTYQETQEVINYVNERDRPLAFYPFSNDKKLVQRYIDSVMSGGVSVNDALFHASQHDLPFGGVGKSGMGHYHGIEGFRSFSKMRPVFYQASFNLMPLLAPPYGKFADRVFGFIKKIKS